jgi:hypothetical protein
LRTALKKSKDDLLAFAKVLDEKLAEVAQRFETPLSLVRAVCLLHRKAFFLCLLAGLESSASSVSRKVSSGDDGSEPSTATNPQSQFSRKSQLPAPQLFFLRRQLGPQYLDLLQFFLNHRTFMRSECPERVDKSPTELMTGQPHAHWLSFWFRAVSTRLIPHPKTYLFCSLLLTSYLLSVASFRLLLPKIAWF